MSAIEARVREVAARATELHARALVIDSMAGGPGVLTPAMVEELGDLSDDLATPEVFRELERVQTRAFRAGTFTAWWDAVEVSGVNVLSVTVGAWGDQPFSFRGAVQDLGEWHQRIDADQRMTLIREANDLRQCVDTRRTGILLGFQECSQLEGDLRNVETFHGLGVRMIQLTYNGRSLAGCGCTEPVDDGLTAFGRDLIRQLNEVGILIDISHCGPKTSLEAIAWSRVPVAVSHAACAGVHPHARNKHDDVLRALGDTGGYFGVCLVPGFIARADEIPSVEHFVAHVQHALELTGPLAVGIGTDWGVECSPPSLRRRLQAEASARGFRPSDNFRFAQLTAGFETWVLGYPRLTEALLDAGLDEPTVERILGENFARFFGAATSGRTP